MKKPTITGLLLIWGILSFAQGIYNNGARIVSTSGSYWVVDNDDFTLTSTSSTNLTQMANLVIKDDASLTVVSGSYLSVTGTLVNSSGTNGLVLESNTSLLHQTSGINATGKQVVPENNHWHFLSIPFNASPMPDICDGNYAPVVGNFNQTTGETYDFYYLDESQPSLNWINLKNDDWSVNTTSFGNPPKFVCGKGYLVAYSSSFAGSETKEIASTLTSGEVTVALTASNLTYNLIGNPYPSSIDWKASSGWTRNIIEAYEGYNMWIWNDAVGNFGAYNSASGSDEGTNGVSRYIAPGQAFYVKAASAGNLIMDNDVRVHSTQNWLKNTSSGNAFSLVVHDLQNNYSDEILIEFGHTTAEGGTKKMTSMYEEAPFLASMKDNMEWAIDFRHDPAETTTIPVSFKSGTSGEFFITSTIGEIATGILEDLRTLEKTTLTNTSSYSFSGKPDDDPNRFLLHFKAVGIDDPMASGQELQIVVWNHDQVLYISNPEQLSGTVMVYDMTGKCALSENLENVTKQTINHTLKPGLYVVRVEAENKTKNQKIMVQ